MISKPVPAGGRGSLTMKYGSGCKIKVARFLSCTDTNVDDNCSFFQFSTSGDMATSPDFSFSITREEAEEVAIFIATILTGTRGVYGNYFLLDGPDALRALADHIENKKL